MTLWAIVPVKPLRRGKSRLAGVLSEDERAALNYTMLRNTLRTLSEVKSIHQILVVSRDPQALALAREFNARTVKEDGRPGLNMALQRASTVAKVYSAQGVIILPADIPLLNSKDVEEILGRTGRPPEMIIVPDRREDGTNALFINPVGQLDYLFGPGSFRRHIQQAETAGYRVEVYRVPSIELDLDLPEDLDLLSKIQNGQNITHQIQIHP
jgi:2-phospho-L-lactate/phosphoenolpyruvate guanylyltransferase